MLGYTGESNDVILLREYRARRVVWGWPPNSLAIVTPLCIGIAGYFVREPLASRSDFNAARVAPVRPPLLE